MPSRSRLSRIDNYQSRTSPKSGGIRTTRAQNSIRRVDLSSIESIFEQLVKGKYYSDDYVALDTSDRLVVISGVLTDTPVMYGVNDECRLCIGAVNMTREHEMDDA